jgi:glycerol-3-phosphate acyltransferase PlsX
LKRLFPRHSRTNGFIFSGNLVLKSSEGVVKMFSQLLRDTCDSSGFLTKIGAFLLKKALKNKFKPLHPSVHNGAMLIGANGIVVKSHGSSDKYGIMNAFKVAVELTRNNINASITKELGLLKAKGIKFNLLDKINNFFS